MTNNPASFLYSLGLVVSLVLLSGCALPRFEQSIKKTHNEIGQRTQDAYALLGNYPGPTPSVVNSQTPRFTSHSIPMDRSEMLPSHIASITLRVPGRHSIKMIAELIQRTTEIPVNVSADATMPPAMFLPIGMMQTATATGPSTSAATTSAVSATAAASPEKIAVNTSFTLPNDKDIVDRVQRAGGAKLTPNNDPLNQDDIELNYSGSLAGLLNQIALRTDLRWSYESGRILFYRVVSRSISVKTMPGSLKLSAGLSLSSTGGGTGSSSSSSDINIWSGIEKNLANMVSVSGKLVIDQNTGTVTVRDSFRNVEAIEQYIQSLNQTLMRQVSMTVEVLQVNLKDEFQSGIDWNYVSDSMRLGKLQIKSPTSVTSADAASTIGLVLKNAAGTTNQLLFQALEKFGRVSSAYSTVVTTVNRQPVPVGNQTTQSYLKSVTPTLMTSANGNTNGTTYGAPSLVPGEITTGFSLTLLPILLDSNQVLVECGLSLSSLKSLTSFNSGSGASLQTIQQPSVANFAVLQRLVAKSNETIVLSGFDAELLQSQQVDPLLQNIPGSRQGSKDRTTTVVLITPRLLEQ
jgi:type IVB pilus formation R64 PilN family outer membrane protein